MTEEEAQKVAAVMAARLTRNSWAVTVSETRGGKWRVVCSTMTGDNALAIYSARVLKDPVAVSCDLVANTGQGY